MLPENRIIREHPIWPVFFETHNGNGRRNEHCREFLYGRIQRQKTGDKVGCHQKQAIQYGNRTIMLHQGKIQPDIKGEGNAKLTINDVVAKFGHSLKDEALPAQ